MRIRVFGSLGVALALTACSEFEHLDRFGGAAAVPPPTSVSLAMGEFQLVAPQGYCIDRRSLRDSFALMARCDTMGAAIADPDMPLALITASLASTVADIPEAAGLVGDQERLIDSGDVGAFRFVAVEGTPPSQDLSDLYFRGAGQIGSFVLGLAVYAPPENRNMSAHASDLMEEAFDRSRALPAAPVLGATGTGG